VKHQTTDLFELVGFVETGDLDAAEDVVDVLDKR